LFRQASRDRSLDLWGIASDAAREARRD